MKKLKTFEKFADFLPNLFGYERRRKLNSEEIENSKKMLNEIEEIIKKYQPLLNLDEDEVREIIYQDLADKLDSFGV